MSNSNIGKLLIQGQYISEEELHTFQSIADEREEGLLLTVGRVKRIKQVEFATYISKKFILPYLDLDMFDISTLDDDIDLKLLDRTRILPIKKIANNMIVATSDPTSSFIQDIKFQTGVNSINVIIVEEDKLIKTIEKYMRSKGSQIGTNSMMEELKDELPLDVADLQSLEIDVKDAPIVKFIHDVIREAEKLKVSDIHFEPYEKSYRVRFRLDGNLFESKMVPLQLKEKIASRIKVMSNLDISEKRIPQDGRFKMTISKDKTMDFRVSTLPTLYGEKIVMRLLDSSIESLDIDKLGYNDEQKLLLLDAVSRPDGMVLVTGPTGSGKTLSLYTCINILNTSNVNICTAEDPVEINLPGVNQVNINEKSGLTFDSALRSFLRQDPNIILVGEIRDAKTADIALKSAQTGHMVLSTLHTNDAPKTITRLLQMGIPSYNISSSVILITAQRLVRRLCPHCKKIVNIPKNILKKSGYTDEKIEQYNVSWHSYGPSGCDECANTGYKGRVGVYQVMPLTEKIKEIILADGTDLDIARVAKADGIADLRDSGLEKVALGLTSLEEVLAATNISTTQY